ncbi:CsuA [Acinetobacter sp. neg1]|uniref:spore coat protein U domain-containing protein n=1 Tax=Acinetobacter sp. neg1 TaxID=1561068 RepID=UPI000541EB3C|nr:spore coat protein U domain-containing protein [Acinetobacter sp. neg1]KHF78797.1 CsuA [Acinetobacter sp. neg1]
MQSQSVLMVVVLTLFIPKVYANDLAVKLNTQIELLPSCTINNNIVSNKDSGLNLGEINFGEVRASFNKVLESSLLSNGGAGFKIKCSGIESVKISFGSGLNDGNVPLEYSDNYYHALTNGIDYLAYNLLYGIDRKVVKTNKFYILNNISQEQTVNIFGRVVNNGTPKSVGSYKDTIPVSIEF